MMMLPKGYEYWIETEERIQIKEDAPEWAKEEFEEYMQMVNELPDEKGEIKHY